MKKKWTLYAFKSNPFANAMSNALHFDSLFADLYEKHRALAQQLKKRTPWFIALTVLVAQAVVAIADKSFQGQELPTVAVTLVLILLFFLANELITGEQVMLRALGFVLWFVALATLPFFVALDRGFDWALLYKQALAVPIFYKAFYTLIALVFLLTPILGSTIICSIR